MRVIIIGSDSLSTKILYNALNAEFSVVQVILEKKESRLTFLKRRIKKLGFLKVLNQLLFILIFSEILQFTSKSRLNNIFQSHNLNISDIPEYKIRGVNSVNSLENIHFLQTFSLDFIVLSGTRIISNRLIKSVNTPILNIHAGITPNYRGVHGAYWAFVNQKKNLAGVTLHYVDMGVDTGVVIAQELISITAEDNYSTYPILQLSLGIQLLKNFLNHSKYGLSYNGSFYGDLTESNQWYHPGFFEYLYNRIILGVK